MSKFSDMVVNISQLFRDAHIPFTQNLGSTAETFAYRLNLSDVFRALNYPVHALIFTGTMHELCSHGVIEQLRYKLTTKHQVSDKDVVLVILKGSPVEKPFAKIPGNWAVVFDSELVTRTPGDPLSLQALLRARVSLKWLNPYKSEGFVSSSMFFGRDAEIDDLCSLGGEARSYVVPGPRRAGKTSLALRLKERFRNVPEMRESMRTRSLSEERYLYYSSYVDLDQIHTGYDIWNLILKEMGLEARDYLSGYAMKIASGKHRELIEREPHDLLSNLLKNKYRRSVIILDEVDKFLRMDRERNWSETSKLRVIAQNPESRTRIIMLGYEDLNKYLRDTSFPFHGKVHPKKLSYFKDSNAAYDLVQLPMEELGITFARQREVVDRIDRATGSNPSLIQEVCRRLVDQIAESKEKQLTPNMVSTLLETHGSSIVQRHYEAFVDIAPFPKLLAYISVPDKLLNVRDYRNKLKSRFELLVDDSEVGLALERLYLHNILDFNDSQYYFANEMIRERLQQDLKQDPMLIPHLVDLIRARGTIF